MTERERGEDGRYTEAVNGEELLAAVDEAAPAGTSEVAEAVGLTRQAVDYRLRQLAESGAVEKQEIGGSLVWSLPEAETPTSSAPRESPQAPAEAPETEPEPAPDPIADVDLEGSGSRLQARRNALRAIVEHLREHGSATAGELKAIADGFEHGYAGADAFWANMRRQDALDELPVETPGRGGKEYRYQR